MKVPTIPKSMANQTATLIKHASSSTEDGERITEEAKTGMTHVVFQPGTIYSGTGNDRTITANGVLFLYAGVTTPMPSLTNADIGSTIEIEGSSYKIQRIIDNREPFSNDIWSYEIEVL
ncbi:putative minor capsid protein [uncultured Weissella sp.]|uniref:putative minor capsid protein n=1 Tax=Weissella viridescens TaxID=1629 RepID=UPI0027DE32DF|nr:putative minor capsid protein [uncultured Weissella sp.]